MDQGVISEGGCLSDREKILTTEQLKGNVLAAGHEGHPGRETMVRKLNVKQYMESCLECLAALRKNTMLPIVERLTLEGVWREFLVDFKGPIKEKY